MSLIYVYVSKFIYVGNNMWVL